MALKGAQLRQVNAEYGRGYLWGVVEAIISVVEGDKIEDLERASRRSNCLMRENITDQIIYDAVMQKIISQPRLLGVSVVQPVIQVINEICEAP